MNLKISKTSLMIIVLVLIYLVFILSADITKIQESLAKMNVSYFIIAILLWSSGNLFRFLRWHLFLKEIDDKVPFKANVMYYLAGFAFVLSPGRLGEIVRSPYIKRDYGIPISKTASIVFVERFYDLLGIIIVLSIGLVFTEFDSTILVVPLAIIVIVVLIFKNKKILVYLLSKISKIRFLKNINSSFEESYSTATKLSKPKFFVIGTVFSSIRFFLTSVAVYVLVLGLEIKLSFEEVLVIFTTSLFVAALSLIPGGIGVFEGGWVALLVLNGVPYDLAITVSLLIRIIGMGIFSAIGLFCLKIISKK